MYSIRTVALLVGATLLQSAAAAPVLPLNACLLANPLCTADGLSVDYYANSFATGYSYPPGGVQSNYYVVDGLTPLASSVTKTTFFPQDSVTPGITPVFPNATAQRVRGSNPYYPGYKRVTNGGIVVDANNYTLVYSGLFKPSTSGTWQICGSTDNENDIYFGDGNAFSCLTGQPGTAANPLAMSVGDYLVNPQKCAPVDLVAGFYYPVRSVMGNSQGPSAFNLTFVPPGVNVANGINNFTSEAYPKTCAIAV